MSSWKEFKDWIDSNIRYGRSYYFRGQRDSSWGLKTTFHRCADTKGITINYYLSEIMPKVNQQVSAYDKQVKLDDETEFGVFLAKLQHHGFPTPLLDWSISPYIAAYFAFKGADQFNDSDKNVSIYIFDIDNWMRDFVPYNNLTGEIDYISDFVPYATGNQRMSRQMGVTTITNVYDMSAFITSKGTYLWKFDIPKSERKFVMHELDLMGINDKTMFPDFDGLCRYLKEVHFDNKQMIIAPPPPSSK